MVIYDSGLLGLWKPSEEEWTAVTFPTDDNYNQGCFVAVDCEGRILRCDASGPTPFEAQLVFEMLQKAEECEQEYPSGSLLYLVQVYLVQTTTGSLLFVLQRERERHTKAFQFQVFEIDLDTRTCTEIESLETHPSSWAATLPSLWRSMKITSLS